MLTAHTPYLPPCVLYRDASDIPLYLTKRAWRCGMGQRPAGHAGTSFVDGAHRGPILRRPASCALFCHYRSEKCTVAAGREPGSVVVRQHTTDVCRYGGKT